MPEDEPEAVRLIGKDDLAPGIRRTAAGKLNLLTDPQPADNGSNHAFSDIDLVVRDVEIATPPTLLTGKVSDNGDEPPVSRISATPRL